MSHHSTRSLLAALSLFLGATATAGDPAPAPADALDQALALEGLTRADLGWTPPGYWSRYPADIPYRLRHFDALMAEPLATVTFARTASASARDALAPDALARAVDKADGPLFQAVQQLGVDRKFGAFRSYSANLPSQPVDLIDALLALYEAGGRATRFHTFGADSPYPNVRAELEARFVAVPAAARPALGRLIADLTGAQGWLELAFRRVDEADRLAVQRRLDLGAELTDALEYFPELDDVAAELDEASLWYGGLQVVAALERARHALADLEDVPKLRADWLSPFGWIRLRGSGDDTTAGDDSFLIVDLGGDDRHTGGGAAPAPGRHLSALLDLAGDDHYEGSDTPTQGAGLAGAGVLLDAAGNDRYSASQCAQGFGQLGLGVLADLGGKDSYLARYSSQGSALLGVGVLLEASGDDRYQIESDGQGFGGAGGVGTLADRAGDDNYLAVRDPKVTGRPSYHSELKVAVSNAQGVGFGRRGDGGDGHSWAGGLGQLLDVEGNDRYTAGNWSMGTGYWFGTGLLHDAAGDDEYHGVVWSQGSGAHFCIGALIDEAGDDQHLVEENGGASLAFGHDFTVALLVNLGGDDTYEANRDGLGYSINRSVALFLDVGGDDRYRGPEELKLGFARHDDKMTKRDGTYTYFADAGSIGMFLDVGGKDRYQHGGGDGETWLDPEDSPNRASRNFSIGLDRADGAVDLAPATQGRASRPPAR